MQLLTMNIKFNSRQHRHTPSPANGRLIFRPFRTASFQALTICLLGLGAAFPSQAQARGIATIDLTQYTGLTNVDVVVDNAKFQFLGQSGTSFTDNGIQLAVGTANSIDSLYLLSYNNTSGAADASAQIKAIEFGTFDTPLNGDEIMHIIYYPDSSNIALTNLSSGWNTLPGAGFSAEDTLWKTQNPDGIGGPFYLKSIQLQSDLIIPEPQTYALIFSSLAFIATLLRRRSRINS